MAYSIFVSHVNEDKEFAVSLKEALESFFLRAIRVFVSSAEGEIVLGSDWFESIENALTEADAVILLLTPRSITRPWVNFEAGAAWFAKKPLLPICAGGLTADQLPPPFNRKQALELRAEADILKLFQSIATWTDLAVPSVDSTDLVSAAERLRAGTVQNATEPVEPIMPHGLPAQHESKELFRWRLGEAFPGLTEPAVFSGEAALNRLSTLLRDPLSQFHLSGSSYNESHPFVWTRGTYWSYVENFRCDSSARCLLNQYELLIDKVVAVRSFKRPDRDFVYVEAAADVPSGIHEYPCDFVESRLKENVIHRRGYFIQESFALWNGRLISVDEWRDGAVIVDERPVLVDNAELRTRNLTRYNFILCCTGHICNRSAFQHRIQEMLDLILREKADVSDLVELVAILDAERDYK